MSNVEHVQRIYGARAMTDQNHCWTCGKPRRLAPVRGSWGLLLTPLVPRTGDPSHRPAQQTNDLICSVSIYRNGGTNESTHLCDDCLGVGLRALKVRIDDLLGEIDAEQADAAIDQARGKAAAAEMD